MPNRRVTFKEVQQELQTLADNAQPGPGKAAFQAYANFLKRFPQDFGTEADDDACETNVRSYGITVPPKQW